MTKRPVTPSYIVFYILFLPDTWQVAIGALATWLITPRIVPQGYNAGAQVLLYFMVAVIGYAASRPLGKKVSMLFKKRILGEKYKGSM